MLILKSEFKFKRFWVCWLNCHKMRQIINKDLTEISRKLNLSIPLKLEIARDAHATILKRGGKSKDQIGEMLGHSNSVVTEHYLGSLDTDKTFEINEVLL